MDCKKPSAKCQRNEEINADQNAVAEAVVVDPPHERQTSDIFKLDIDCFEEVFDYLPLTDLISVGKTCKRLNQVAGYCFRLNYSGYRIKCTPKRLKIFRRCWNVTHFAQFIRNIIMIESKSGLKYFTSIQSKLRRVREIEIKYIKKMSQTKIDRMKEILSKVEDLRFEWCKLSCREIIAHCPNLRRLHVRYCETDLDWLSQKSSTLQCFTFLPDESDEAAPIANIIMFLEQNPNIRKFATEADFLLENIITIKNSGGIRLDVLSILIHRFPDFIPLCNQLNELYERGFFKRLEVYIWGNTNQEWIDKLAALNGFVKICIYKPKDDITLSALNNIEELCLRDASDERIKDLGNTVVNLSKLKRIHFVGPDFEWLLPFIQRSTELDKIATPCIYDENISDLVELNRQRAKLPDARKITIYVCEEDYLMTKWVLKETDFGLIRLKRRSSIKWNSDFIINQHRLT